MPHTLLRPKPPPSVVSHVCCAYHLSPAPAAAGCNAAPRQAVAVTLLHRCGSTLRHGRCVRACHCLPSLRRPCNTCTLGLLLHRTLPAAFHCREIRPGVLGCRLTRRLYWFVFPTCSCPTLLALSFVTPPPSKMVRRRRRRRSKRSRIEAASAAGACAAAGPAAVAAAAAAAAERTVGARRGHGGGDGAPQARPSAATAAPVDPITLDALGSHVVRLSATATC